MHRVTAAVAVVLVGTGFARAALTDGLVGYWALDEGTGTEALDGSGLGNHGAFSPEVDRDPSWTAGKYGSALSFDGDDRLIVPHDASLAPTTVSVAAWVKLDVAVGSQQAQYNIVDKSSWNDKDGYWLSFDRPYKSNLTMRIMQGSSYRDAAAGAGSMQVGTWYHVVGVFDGSEIRLYVDGDEKGSTSYSGMDPSTVDLRIGNNMQGTIDDVAVWNRALGEQEIIDLASGTMIPEPASVLLLLGAGGLVLARRSR